MIRNEDNIWGCLFECSTITKITDLNLITLTFEIFTTRESLKGLENDKRALNQG